MRVRYSFSCRKTGHIDNIRKQRQKYPVLLLKVVETSDIILEVMDARFFEEMRNKDMEKLILKQGKQILRVLNKSDLLANKIPKEKLEEVKPYAIVSCTERHGSKDLRDKIKIMAKQVKKTNKGKYSRIQVGVIGYPNAGKSSIINLLTGKTGAGVGADAGYTRGIQKLKLTTDILLLDSPGVIPEKDYSYTEQSKISKHTKVGGKSYSQVKNPELVVSDLIKQYPEQIKKFYNVEGTDDSEEITEEIGKKRGFLIKGGLVDEDKTSRQILKDFQAGKIKV